MVISPIELSSGMVAYQRETRTLLPSPIAVTILSMKEGFDSVLTDLRTTSLAFSSFTTEANEQSRGYIVSFGAISPRTKPRGTVYTKIHHFESKETVKRYHTHALLSSGLSNAAPDVILSREADFRPQRNLSSVMSCVFWVSPVDGEYVHSNRSPKPTPPREEFDG